MKLVCDYEIFGQGSMTVELSEIDDLTPEGVEEWLADGVVLAIVEQGEADYRLRPRYSEAELLEAIEAERKEREG